MPKLKTEYTDRKNVKHQVEHILIADENKKNDEQILDELIKALERKEKRIPT